ncbi:MAG: DNA mismatch repair endonuclease MutL [Treponema sp.]
MNHLYNPIQILPVETALKIAAGEVIEKPASVVRELLDNSIDSGADKINLEIEDGGISKIKVLDNGYGMTKEDLLVCTCTHSTSKIRVADDLLHLSSLGFRGEALSSIQAVSDLEIISKREGFPAWKLKNNEVEAVAFPEGTSVEVKNLFENFPARKKFLKRGQFEGLSCRQIFIEKSLPFYNIHMSYVVNGKTLLVFDKTSSLKERCLQVFSSAFGFKENEKLFFELHHEDEAFSFNLVLGTPDVYRSSKKYINVFVNGRKINEYGFIQSICYGSEGYFPNGNYPVAFLFLQANPSRVDFNIHPAKREAHFEDYNEIHRVIHKVINTFYKQKTIMSMFEKEKEEDDKALYLNDSLKVDSQSESLHSFNSNRSVFNDDVPFSNEAEKENKASYFDVAYVSAIFPIKKDCFQVCERQATYGFANQKKAFKVLGQFCGTFIAVEKDNALYIVDQHAAHERIIYEVLKKSVGASQELLAPYILETSTEKNDAIIRKNQQALKEAGFKILEIGNGRWEVTAVPIFYKGTQKHLLNDIVQAKDADNLISHLLATASCRAACKDGDILDDGAMYSIVEKAFLLEEPLCPHGRPIYFILDKMELFRKVKRIT